MQASRGCRFKDVHDAAMKVIAACLHEGILPVTLEESLSPEASSTVAGCRTAPATTWAWTHDGASVRAELYQARCFRAGHGLHDRAGLTPRRRPADS